MNIHVLHQDNISANSICLCFPFNIPSDVNLSVARINHGHTAAGPNQELWTVGSIPVRLLYMVACVTAARLSLCYGGHRAHTTLA